MTTPNTRLEKRAHALEDASHAVLKAECNRVTQQFRENKIRIQSVVAQRQMLMAAGYVTGQYPVPAAKKPWMDALIDGLKHNGYIAQDHTGRITITLDFRAGGLRHHDVEEVIKLTVN